MKKILRILFVFISIFIFPIVFLLANTTQQYISRAGGTPANITVDTTNILGTLARPWRALAQGGEENPPMLRSVVPDIRMLSPTYIRIDHIYDLYSVVTKVDGSLQFDFSRLDETVNDILASGALPFLSLSYMPMAIAQDGTMTGVPSNWKDWEDIVEATVEHYSGKNQKNLTNVYYEVWNEPDIFGRWDVSGAKDYRLLYLHSVLGANRAVLTNSFLIGGPATTHLDTSWMDAFIRYVADNNLRLDFLSWHRYSKDPMVFSSEADLARSIIGNYPRIKSVPFILSEWAIDSENNPFFDTNVAAAHEAASIRQMIDKMALAFTFEIKDGPPPSTSPFWGRWGLITNDKAGLVKKPRYFALQFLNKLVGNRLAVSGEGSFVSALSATDGNTISLLLVNYDVQSLHTEGVPVRFDHLTSGSYTLEMTYLNGTTQKNAFTITSGVLAQTVMMTPNDIVLLQLTKTAAFAAFTSGRSGQTGDGALVLSSPMVFANPPFQLSSTGSIAYEFKPNWNGDDNTDRILWDVPFTISGVPKRLALQKKKVGFSNKLVFGVFDQTNSLTTTASIDNWIKGVWHRIQLNWNPSGLMLIVDNQQSQLSTLLDIGIGDPLIFYASDGVIDNLSITINNREVIQRTFDGGTDR